MHKSANNGFPGTGPTLCSPALDLQAQDPLIVSLPPEMTSFLPCASSGHPSVLSTPQAELPTQAPLPASKGPCWAALISSCYWEAEQLWQCASHPSPLPAACSSGPLVHPFGNHGFVYSETGRQRLIMGQTGSSHFLSRAPQTFAQQQQQVLFF